MSWQHHKTSKLADEGSLMGFLAEVYKRYWRPAAVRKSKTLSELVGEWGPGVVMFLRGLINV